MEFSLVDGLFNQSPIFLRIQIQLMRLLVGLLVGQLLPSFYIVWYDLPTNSPTNNRISWICILYA